MRAPADGARIHELARRLGRIATDRVRIYLTGGATAVLEGWRPSTIDVDLRMEPERDELLRAFAELKQQLDINIELASPPDFIPELPEWRERSPFVFREGNVDVYHFDPYSQTLSKVERGFVLDLQDARTMIARGLVVPSRLLELYEAIRPALYRYPAIDPPAFEFRLRELVGSQGRAA